MMRRAKSSFEKYGAFGPVSGAAILACALLMASSIELSQAAPTRATFPTADDAGSALVFALQAHDERMLRQILGGGSEMGADGETENALERQHFVQKYLEMHRWARVSDEIKTLYVGAENWSFPVPLVSSNGTWRFDSEAGADEIRFRRIGENELTAIGLCGTLIRAKLNPETDADGLVETLLPPTSANKPLPFHGYYFRTPSKPDGSLSAVAYPAAYRASGVMTFIVTRDGSVWEKDLGPSTANIAQAIQSYHPDATWTRAE